jgi:outer membrane lipoprotein SlyB
MRSATTIAAALAALSLLAGCAGPSKSGSTYSDREARRPMQVTTGTIQAIREVRLERDYQSGVGTAAGAAVGGIAGSNVGGGKGAWVGSIAGAVLGGVAGSHAEKSLSDRPGLEITVRTDDGRTLSVVQEAGNDRFVAGQRIRMLTDGYGQVRITPQ